MPGPSSLFGRAVAIALAGFCALAASAPVRADEAGWAALKEPGTHVLMRHAIAPGTGDPAGFRLGDCSTQRNLDGDGRAQAKAIGEALRANGIVIDHVLSSQWCRARETAEGLGVGPVEDEPALNSFFDDRGGAQAATAAVSARLAALGKGSKAALVTHQVNITALTEVFPASGEMIVVSLGDGGKVEVRGRIRTE